MLRNLPIKTLLGILLFAFSANAQGIGGKAGIGGEAGFGGGPSTSGTFTLVQTGNCAIGSGASTCSITVSPAFAAGNLDEFACYPPNTGGAPATAIASVNAGGTLVPALASGWGGYGSGSTANMISYAYILPSSSTGHASPIVITLNQATTGTGGYCYLAEYHPSANGSNVGLDDDLGFQPSAACTTCTNANVTFSGTGDTCLQGFIGVSGYTSPSAISSPYSTTDYLPGSGNGVGFATAVPSNGNGPSWTTSSVTPFLSAMCFGWNVSAFNPQTFVDFESGTAGNNPAAADLASATHGWQGGRWVSSVVAMKYATAASMPLLNSTGRLGDGSSYSAGSGTLGLSITGNGTAETDYVTYSWSQNTLGPNYANTVLVFKYNENLAATDTTSIDCGSLIASSDYAGANCYGTGSTRYVRLETDEGNGSNISWTPSTSCPCTIVIQYNAGNGVTAGTHSVSAYNSSGSLLGTSTHVGSTAATYVYQFHIGQFAANAITTGKLIQWDSVQLSLNSTVPNQ